MAREDVTIALDGSNVNGSDFYTGHANDTQFVTFTDGGDLDGKTITLSKFGKGRPTEPGEGPGGNDRFDLDLSKFNDNFGFAFQSLQNGDTIAVYGYDSVVQEGTVYTYQYTGTDGQKYTFTMDTASKNSQTVNVVCFGGDTIIQTPAGCLPVSQLEVGDPVLCGDGQVRKICWIGERWLSPRELERSPHLRPVKLSPDALGRGMPEQELLVSPQHRLLIDDWRAEMLFGEAQVLVAAIHLTNDTSIRQVLPEEGIDYYHFILEEHATVFANGLRAESLLPGEEAQAALGGAARSEIADIFPELPADLESYGGTCARTLKAFEGRLLRNGF